jgi:hypothetical protein
VSFGRPGPRELQADSNLLLCLILPIHPQHSPYRPRPTVEHCGCIFCACIQIRLPRQERVCACSGKSAGGGFQFYGSAAEFRRGWQRPKGMLWKEKGNLGCTTTREPCVVQPLRSWRGSCYSIPDLGTETCIRVGAWQGGLGCLGFCCTVGRSGVGRRRL